MTFLGPAAVVVEVIRSRPELNPSSSPSPSPSPTTMISYTSRTILKTVLKMLLKLILKLWKWASSFAIVIFFVSWYYGGVLPYFVCFIALLSKYCTTEILFLKNWAVSFNLSITYITFHFTLGKYWNTELLNPHSTFIRPALKNILRIWDWDLS